MLREFHGGRMPRFRAGPDFSTTVSYSPMCTASPCLFTGTWFMKRSTWKLKAMTFQGWHLEGVGVGPKACL